MKKTSSHYYAEGIIQPAACSYRAVSLDERSEYLILKILDAIFTLMVILFWITTNIHNTSRFRDITLDSLSNEHNQEQKEHIYILEF